MKRTPLRRRTRLAPISERQAERAADLKVGKFAKCFWCKARGLIADAVEKDHLIPRSLLPGENRDHPDNVVDSCRHHNTRRAEGHPERWDYLTPRQQRFILQQKGVRFAERYFVGVPENDSGAAAGEQSGEQPSLVRKEPGEGEEARRHPPDR